MGGAVPIPADRLRDTTLTGPLGSLAISFVCPANSSLALRTVRWLEGLQKLGLRLPFFLVHDVGLIFSTPETQYEKTARTDIAALTKGFPDAARLLGIYQGMLREMSESEVCRKASLLKMNDDLIVVLLSRILGAVASRIGVAPAYRSALPMDASLLDDIDAQLPALFGSVRRDFELRTLAAIEATRLFVLTMSDALDLDTLRLFGMIGSEASLGAMAQVDLLAALESPEANDTVNFSLEILPSVLETKTRAAAGFVAAHGYSGIGNKGSVDSMVLTELAWDDMELARRILDNEVLYYMREQSRDLQKRIHYLLIDASASMRGDRQTFARGMAIATGKKLLLEGEEVVFRFFDSRLYEPARARHGQLPTAYILSFKGERGRNPARVFAELATDLDLLRHRDARTPVVHLFTHAALYIPREMVQAVRNIAQIAGVFILPSGGRLELDYLDLLHSHWVIDHETLASRTGRADAAKTILGKTQGASFQGGSSQGQRKSFIPPLRSDGAEEDRHSV